MGLICGQTFKTKWHFHRGKQQKTNTILKEDKVPGAKLLKKPEKCVIEELKRWLECHGLKKSGKKDDLINRVRDGLKLNLSVDPKIDGGKWYNLKTKDSASTKNTSSKTPIASLGDLPGDGWRLFPSKNLPANFNYEHVYFYLVESAAKASNIPDSSDSDEGNLYANCNTVTAKPLKKGRNLLTSRFVKNVQDNFDEIKHEFYVRAHAQHSMKNMLPMNVNVVISDTSGYVKVVLCDCKASALGRCAHVAALLLKLSDTAHYKGSMIKPSTSQPCTWNRGKKREKTLSNYTKPNTAQANVNCLLNYIRGIQGLET